MLKTRNVLKVSNFAHLFKILVLGAVNDNILRNALLVLLTFSGVTIYHLSTAQAVNLAVFLFLLPFFLFSSYAGKIADSFYKVKIIRIVKLCEIIIMLGAAIGFIYHLIWLLFLCIFLMGMHSTFFGPIKFSIVPQYLKHNELVMANGYIEMGTFAGILIGQSIGSWFMANQMIIILISIMIAVSLMGYLYSFKLDMVPPATSKVKFYKNVLQDIWAMYSVVAKDSLIRKNLHMVSWFWGFGIIFTTQLPVLTRDYFGGDAHFFTVLIGLFTIGIGMGSLICAKLSHTKAVPGYATFGGCAMSIGLLVLLLTHYQTVTTTADWLVLLNSLNGAVIFILSLLIGIAAGFYSVTCYNTLQMNSLDEIRSQVISAVNILNASYMVIASIISSLLLMVMSPWWLLLTAALCNLVFVILT
ncbi:MAG: MFS transporter [Burkholderiales bacterium]|nr:MFS transporter [Burkholderiales bacterium]